MFAYSDGHNAPDPLPCSLGHTVAIRAFAIFITAASTAFARTVPTNTVGQGEDIYLYTAAGASGSNTVLKCGIGILDGPEPGVDFETTALGAGFLGQGSTSATADMRNAANQWRSDPAVNFDLILIPNQSDSMGDAMTPLSSEDEIFTEAPPVLEGGDTRLIVAITLVFRPATFEGLNVSMGTAAVAFNSQVEIEYSLESRSDTNDGSDTGLRLTGNGGTIHAFSGGSRSRTGSVLSNLGAGNVATFPSCREQNGRGTDG